MKPTPNTAWGGRAGGKVVRNPPRVDIVSFSRADDRLDEQLGRGCLGVWKGRSVAPLAPPLVRRM